MNSAVMSGINYCDHMHGTRHRLEGWLGVNSYDQPAKHTHADKLAQARARFGKPFACDPGSTFRFRRDRTILDDWQDALREQRAAAQAEVPDLMREQAA